MSHSKLLLCNVFYCLVSVATYNYLYCTVMSFCSERCYVCHLCFLYVYVCMDSGTDAVMSYQWYYNVYFEREELLCTKCIPSHWFYLWPVQAFFFDEVLNILGVISYCARCTHNIKCPLKKQVFYKAKISIMKV